MGKKETLNRSVLLSVISPCYNESEVIRLFYEELKPALESLWDFKHEIIFVDDGNTDNTLSQLNQIAQADPCVRVCSLSRNFGHQIALTAGLDLAVGQAVLFEFGPLEIGIDVTRRIVT
jgi:dolichol-phosphate mannosyltransferase